MNSRRATEPTPGPTKAKTQRPKTRHIHTRGTPRPSNSTAAIKNINAKAQGRKGKPSAFGLASTLRACQIATPQLQYTGTSHHRRCDLPLNDIKPRAAATFLPTFCVVTKSRSPKAKRGKKNRPKKALAKTPRPPRKGFAPLRETVDADAGDVRANSVKVS